MSNFSPQVTIESITDDNQVPLPQIKPQRENKSQLTSTTTQTGNDNDHNLSLSDLLKPDQKNVGSLQTASGLSAGDQEDKKDTANNQSVNKDKAEPSKPRPRFSLLNLIKKDDQKTAVRSGDKKATAQKNIDESIKKQPEIPVPEAHPSTDQALLPAIAMDEQEKHHDDAAATSLPILDLNQVSTLVAAEFDLGHAENVLDSYLAQLRDVSDHLVLDKDDFAGSLTTILDTLVEKRAPHDEVMAALNQAAADDNLALQVSQKSLQSTIETIQSSREQLIAQIDKLLSTFPSGNNWYRLLAAWDIFSVADYSQLVAEHHWLDRLREQALDLFGSDFKQKLFDHSLTSEHYLAETLDEYFATLRDEGIKLDRHIKERITTRLSPLLQEYLTTNREMYESKRRDQTVEQLRRDATQTAVTIETLSDKQNQLTDRCETLECKTNRIGELEAQLAESQNRLNELEKSRQDLQDRNHALHDDLKNTVTTLTRQLNDTQKRFVGQLEASDIALRRAKEAFAKRASELDDQLKSLHDTYGQSNKANEDLTKRFSVLDEKLNVLKTTYTDTTADKQARYEERFAHLGKRVKQSSEQCSQLWTRTKTIEGELSDLRQQLKKLVQANEQLQARNDKLHHDKQQLENDLATVIRKNEGFDEKIAQLREHYSGLEAENEELRIANAGLKQANWQARHAIETGQPPADLTVDERVDMVAEPVIPEVAIPANVPTSALIAKMPAVDASAMTTEVAGADLPLPDLVPAVAADQTTNVVLPTINSPSTNFDQTESTSSELILPQMNTDAASSPSDHAPAATTQPSLANPEPKDHFTILGITKRRLAPGSYLLTRQPLTYLGLQNSIGRAIAGYVWTGSVG